MKIFFITKMHNCWMCGAERSDRTNKQMSVHTSVWMCVCVCVYGCCAPFSSLDVHMNQRSILLFLSRTIVYLCSVHSFDHSISAFFFKTTMKKTQTYFFCTFLWFLDMVWKKYPKNIGGVRNEVRKKTCKIPAKRWKMHMKERCACKKSIRSKVEKSMWISCRKKSTSFTCIPGFCLPLFALCLCQQCCCCCTFVSTTTEFAKWCKKRFNEVEWTSHARSQFTQKLLKWWSFAW